MSTCAPWKELFEDKKCRICGLADISNINIFNDKILRMKISTVYPIIMHQDDPLPKNICRKCVSTVSSMYNDIHKVIKLQNKWTQNVRANEPQNTFLQSLDLLETAIEAIKNLLTTTYNTILPSETINRLITTALIQAKKPEDISEHESSETLTMNGEKSENLQIKEEPNDEEEKEEEEEEEDRALSKVEASKRSSLSAAPSPLTVMCSYCPLQFESLARLSLHQNIHLRLQIPKIFQKKFLNKVSRRGRLITIKNRKNLRCLNCWRIFNDKKCILEHWSKGDCDFYCQICGKEYEQSPKMLREHVLVAHGISYKSLKKQLNRLTKKRMSSKIVKNKKECAKLASTQPVHIQKNSESSKNLPSAPSNHLNNLVICRICSRTFRNFKACNSHMRAHKPPYAYSETAPLPDIDADAYIEHENKNLKKESPSTPESPPTMITATVSNEPPTVAPTSPAPIPSQNIPNSAETLKPHDLGLNIETKLSLPPEIAPSQAATKMPTSTLPRGIRMKFVSRRSDLNGSGPSIKVKSLSDLQGGQQPMFIPNHIPKVNEIQNVLPTISPLIPLNASFISPNIKNEPLDNMIL